MVKVQKSTKNATGTGQKSACWCKDLLFVPVTFFVCLLLGHLAYRFFPLLWWPALYWILISSRTVMYWRERVQRRAARWITSKHDRGTSITALLHQLHLEPLEECKRISRLTFLYKILNEHVVVPMNQLDLVLCDRPVRGPTTKQRLKIPRGASTQFQKFFAARTITGTHYQTPITSLASVSSFRSHLSAKSCP